MEPISDIAQEITRTVLETDTVKILDTAKIGEGSWQNELLLFIKPEVFLVSDAEASARAVDLILDKIREFGANVQGIAVVGGRVLEEKEIMSQHYGFINVLSRTASQVLNDDDKKKIEAALGTSIRDSAILGGHEFLARYPQETAASLDRFWFTGPSTKIRSGFYVRAVQKEGQDIILVNGFHPEQLAHFTTPSHKIVLMLLHSNTNWSRLKNTMVGATFPEKAAPESIRGIFHAHPKEYGFDTVTIANNCVHLSAGPFEAMFEIVNFFGKIIGLDTHKQPPLLLRRMLDTGLSFQQATQALDNPVITKSGKSTDLFTATEDMDTDDAVSLFKEGFS